MRVAIDEQIFAIQRYGGISRLFAELAREFSGEAIPGVDVLPIKAPIVNRYVLDDPDLVARLRVREAPNPWIALARYMSRLRSHANADIVHNTFYLPHGLTPMRGAKRIVTVHDMIPELMPDTRRRLDFLTLKRRYVDNADHIICVSEATHRDLVEVYGPLDAPVTVVHHGVDPRFHPGVPRLDFLPARYVLFVGNRDQYKDADVLFQAFARIATDDESLQLLCVGGAGLTEDEVARLKALGIRERVSQRYLADDAMAAAYAHAQLFVFPSRYEGFGIPAMEAMASGVPAVLANATSLPEVGGDAALYFEPGDVDDLARKIGMLLHDHALRERLRAAGIERAAMFTWSRTAKQTAEVYAKALSTAS